MKNNKDTGGIDVNIFKLLVLSVFATNIGYSFFLMPVLCLIYPDKVPFTFINIISFVGINSAAGLFLGLCTYLLSKFFIKSFVKAAGISIVFLWLLYWLPGLKNLEILILCLDGIAAFFTWWIFVVWNHKSKIKERMEVEA